MTQELGKPAVAAICDEFIGHGRTMSGVLGHPQLEMLVLPYPLEGRSDEDLAQVAADYYPKVLQLLGAKPA